MGSQVFWPGLDEQKQKLQGNKQRSQSKNTLVCRDGTQGRTRYAMELD